MTDACVSAPAEPEIDVSMIIPDLLFLGSCMAAHSLPFLKTTRIRAVLNVTADVEMLHETFCPHVRIPVADRYSENIRRYFDIGVGFIHQHTEVGNTVLVHCAQGISRSSTIVIAYLIKQKRMSLRESLGFLRSSRPQVAPNIGFLRCLLELELETLGCASMTDRELVVDALAHYLPSIGVELTETALTTMVDAVQGDYDAVLDAVFAA
jgi:hypothetical protein